MWVYPKRPEGEKPMSFSATAALGLVLSQQDVSPFWQNQQLPHAIVNGTTTRIPFLIRLTSDPTSTTSPMNSCPRMSPGLSAGMNLPYRCKSDPQMQVVVVLMMTSLALRIWGSGTRSTRTSCLPHQVSAFIGVSFRLRLVKSVV